MPYKQLRRKVFFIYHKKSGKFFCQKLRDGTLRLSSFGSSRVIERKRQAEKILRQLGGNDFAIYEHSLTLFQYVDSKGDLKDDSTN